MKGGPSHIANLANFVCSPEFSNSLALIVCNLQIDHYEIAGLHECFCQRYMRMFCARSCEFCEQPEASVAPSQQKVVEQPEIDQVRISLVVVDYRYNTFRVPGRLANYAGKRSDAWKIMPLCMLAVEHSSLQVQISNRPVHVLTSRGWLLSGLHLWTFVMCNVACPSVSVSVRI